MRIFRILWSQKVPRSQIVVWTSIVSLLLLSACAGQPPEVPAPSATPTLSKAPTKALPAETPAGPNEVDVSLTEFAIDMPEAIPAGPTRFLVENNGAFTHNIRIVGAGIDVALPSNLSGGERDSLEVDLPPGEYRVYCPVGNHAERGMDITLTVNSG